MSAAPLPTIEQWLSALIPRVRALRVAHGLSCLAATALGTATAVLLLDAGFALSAWARGLFLSVWLTALGVLAWRWILIPWRGEVPLTEVAREVEKRFPELGGRLRAAVTDAPDGSSRVSHTATTEDTARRLRTVERDAAVPLKPGGWLAAVSATALCAVVATAALVPGSGERLRRVALPWHRNGAVPFRVVATSGEPVVRRGGPVTLSAYAERTGPVAHTEAALVTRDGLESAETRRPMTGDGTAFHITLPSATADFDYCIEIGAARSEWLHVSVLDAVELTEGTRIEIAAPEYAKRPKRTLGALTDLDGLQFGTASFRLKFNLPAQAAHFDWRPDGATRSELIALELTPDRLAATGTFALTSNGILRLGLVRELDGKKLRTDTSVAVRVAPDEPPRFEEIGGVTPRPRTARPGSSVPIRFVACDDRKVAEAELQYLVGSDETKWLSIPIPLTDAGGTRAVGRLAFDLADKGREGETIRFRLRVTDNRTLDDPKLPPQEVFYPPGGWSELKLSPTAPPLDQQDIVCQREATSEALAGALLAANELAAEADSLRTETADRPALADEQTARLNNAREKLRTTAARLIASASDATLTPELRAIAADAQGIAEGSLKRAEDGLRTAETDDPHSRKEALARAFAALTEAGAKLSDLQTRNTRLGQDRLDRAKLNALAVDQSLLADPKPGDDARLRRQRELIERLTAIVAGSESLGRAVADAKGEEVRRHAAELEELAALIRDLDAAAKQLSADAQAAIVAAIAREQDTLTTRAAALFGELDTAARLAGVALPALDDLRCVADLAAAGRTVESLVKLEKHAQAIEGLATTFDKWHAERADAKWAAKQLVRWQDDLLARLRASANVGGFGKLPDDAKAALRAEQKALHGAILALALPAEDGIVATRGNAARHAVRASECLAIDGIGADDSMKLVSEVLTRLTERTPLLTDRLTRSRPQFEKLRHELETTGNAIEGLFKGVDRVPDAKKLAIQLEKQRAMIGAVAALDLPGLGARQARVGLALKAAVSDLQDGSPLDIAASQLWARREFERLGLVLEGYTPPDAKAEELFRKVLSVAGSVEAHGPTVTKQQLEPALSDLQEVQRQLTVLGAAEAPALLNDARNAVQSAEVALRHAKPNLEAIRSRVRAAADALGRLSDRLDGSESDLDRVHRLATARRLAIKLPADKLKELLASDETYRQLGREADELTATRVGVAGQASKKRALDLYARLRARAEPDRAGTDLKALATALDELSAKMADVAELASGVARVAPVAPPEADAYLPSRALANRVRELSQLQRTIHAQVTNFPVELKTRLHPSETNPFPALGAKQRALAVEALALAKQLGTPPATNAAAEATRAATRLLVAQVPRAKDAAEHAANFLRQLATLGHDRPWGIQADGLVAQQDALIAEMTELLGATNAVAAQHVARSRELGHLATELASRLELTAASFGPTDANRLALTDAATALTDAAEHLAEAAHKTTEGAGGEAEKHRGAAETLIRSPALKVAALAPPVGGTNDTSGLALRCAQQAMRAAETALVRNDADGARLAMRDAARALQEAATGVGK